MSRNHNNEPQPNGHKRHRLYVISDAGTNLDMAVRTRFADFDQAPTAEAPKMTQISETQNLSAGEQIASLTNPALQAAVSGYDQLLQAAYAAHDERAAA